MTTEYEAALKAAGVPMYTFGFGPRPQYQDFYRDRKTDSFKDYRHPFVKKFAWAIPDLAALKMIARYSPIIEVGSGTGYWAYELRKLGASVIATDLREPKNDDEYQTVSAWTRVASPIPAAAAARAFDDRALMLVWPSYSENWAAEALRYYRGDTVIYVGEGPGGCTGDNDFHDQLDREWFEIERMTIPQWGGINDRLEIFRRKP